ncbi:methyltransferase [Streptomyces geranii]|uniref:methyltransferase n=1 Tax=Streptomyces geranii TaxID=2058923 RepID=UPI000D02C363|nr:methyltransferase [Streptomyces geranii]
MEAEQKHAMAVGQLAIGGWFSRALAVTARLGIADILDGGHLPHTEIAERTGSDPDVMLRLLRALVFVGAAERDADGAFGITEPFQQLRTDHPLSLRHTVMLFAETYDDAFGALQHTVSTGKSGFQKVFGASIFEHFERDPEAARVFDLAMVELARPVAVSLLRARDFSGVGTIVDVGGGGGAMLRGILRSLPDVKGVSTDRHSVCERAAADLAKSPDSGLADRLTFEPADFFQAVPAGGDLYLLKNVLRDWAFESGRRILGTVARAMTTTAQKQGADTPVPHLLVIEPPITQDFDAARELFQMVACEEGMHGLSEEGMRGLLDAAGFDVRSVHPLPTGHNVYDATVRTTTEAPR